MTLSRSKLMSMTAQQSLIGFLGLAFSVVIFRQSGLSDELIVQKLQWVLVAYAIGTLLQAVYWKKIAIGTGLMLPPISGAIYVQPSILAIAIAIGGIPLLIGMTIFAGFCEFVLSFILRRTRIIFPPEICGLVLLLVGLELGVTSIHAGAVEPYMSNGAILVATLIPILVLSVWGKGYIRHICSMIGVLFGFIMALYLEGGADFKALQVPFLTLPSLEVIKEQKIAFDWSLSLPFFLVGFAATIRSLGLTMSVQQANDPHWRKPDYDSLQRSIRTDGLAAMIAGMLGVNGINVSPTSTTMAIAFRCTDVVLSYAMSIVFLLLSCCTGLLIYIATSPLPIVAGLLLYYAAFIFTGGIRTIGAQSFGIRQVFIIGISFFVAVSTYILPQAYQALPSPLDVFGRSSLALGLIFAVALNMIFSIGSRRNARFILRMDSLPDRQIHENINTYGNSWGLKQDLVEDTILIAKEIAHDIHHANLAESDIIVETKDNTIAFCVSLSYTGAPYKMMPLQTVNMEKILDEEMFIEGLKIYLRGMMPDKVSTSLTNNDQCCVIVSFNH
ncbi:solute carrier family 23 protein [uncultured Shewanella sp.]|uniref:solute carrier family 23 protein n=1 Tax=uncultured Shewanella sp. TaxID=173975 RepID=UPI00260E6B84|nr:solute carrier family 23 protein [uncultured Shewanella sp.]